MATIKILEMNELVPGKYYNLIFQEFDGKIKFVEKLGRFISMSLYGRSYDPDVIMTFQNETGKEYTFEPPFESSYGYIEYIGEEKEA